MRAMVLQDFESDIKLANLPQPEPGASEVLVAIQASSVNGFDIMLARGHTKGMMEHAFPVVLGRDFAGTVTAVGERVTRFAPGDRVFGVVGGEVLRDGSWGEYLVSPEDGAITHLPENLDFKEGGAIGNAAVTALQSLDLLNLAKGDTLLISGATGGVGSYAVQLAANRGLTVIATAKPGAEADYVRGFGAGDTVDYTGDLTAAVRALRPDGVHGVLHLAGDGATLTELVAPGGRLASTIGFTQAQAGERDLNVIEVWATPDSTTLERLASQAAAGQLHVPLQASYPLDAAPKALEEFANGAVGKIGITITD